MWLLRAKPYTPSFFFQTSLGYKGRPTKELPTSAPLRPLLPRSRYHSLSALVAARRWRDGGAFAANCGAAFGATSLDSRERERERFQRFLESVRRSYCVGRRKCRCLAHGSEARKRGGGGGCSGGRARAAASIVTARSGELGCFCGRGGYDAVPQHGVCRGERRTTTPLTTPRPAANASAHKCRGRAPPLATPRDDGKAQAGVWPRERARHPR